MCHGSIAVEIQSSLTADTVSQKHHDTQRTLFTESKISDLMLVMYVSCTKFCSHVLVPQSAVIRDCATFVLFADTTSATDTQLKLVLTLSLPSPTPTHYMQCLCTDLCAIRSRTNGF
jgi:hypothetical protein